MSSEFENNKYTKLGNHVEKQIHEELLEKYSKIVDKVETNVIRSVGYFPEYDFIIYSEDDLKIESKADYSSIYNRQLVAEIYGYNGKSGLTTTKADFWVFVDGFRRIWISVDELRKYIISRNLSISDMRGDGDSYVKKVYYLPFVDFFEYVLNLENQENRLKGLKLGFITYIKSSNPMYWYKCFCFNEKLSENCCIGDEVECNIRELVINNIIDKEKFR